jgi:hypothetical protein
MEYKVVISDGLFRRALEQLASGSTGRVVYPAGISRLGDQVEFLAGGAPGSEASVVMQGVNRREGFADALRVDTGLHSGVVLALGVGAAAGLVAGVRVVPDGLAPLNQIDIIEAGLPRIDLMPAGRTVGEVRDQGQTILSRSIGALGEEAWQRLTSLHFAVVGCGRSGQLVATGLARLGVRRITALDPDRLELHNLGEGDGVRAADVGTPKVRALANHLQREALGAVPVIREIDESIFSLSSLVALKAADVVVCCVDSAAARIATTFLGGLYLKVLVDVGTGILQPNRHARQMGMDVRLVLPGRCLLCFGGVAGVEQARRELATGSVAQPVPDWRSQRAGSLRSLNQLATGFALRLIEDFVQGRVRDSVWLHMEVQESGIPVLEHRAVAQRADCPLCRLSGLGDGGIHLLPSVLQQYR